MQNTLLEPESKTPAAGYPEQMSQIPEHGKTFAIVLWWISTVYCFIHRKFLTWHTRALVQIKLMRECIIISCAPENASSIRIHFRDEIRINHSLSCVCRILRILMKIIKHTEDFNSRIPQNTKRSTPLIPYCMNRKPFGVNDLQHEQAHNFIRKCNGISKLASVRVVNQHFLPLAWVFCLLRTNEIWM